MKLSIVVLNYNVKHFLQLCLQSVVRATKNLDAEIIVIDNASEDGSMLMVTKDFPQVVQIQNTENVGFSKANNQAVKQASGDYICILNPDTVVGEDTFLEVLSYAEMVPDFGAIGVKLIDGTGQFLPESKRNLPTPKVALQKLWGNSKSYYATHISDFTNGKVDVLVGAFMLMRKDRYDQVGGFDEDYFMYGEDIDLSYKLTKAGYQNYYFGEQTVLHFKGESTSKDNVYRERFYGAMHLFYEKHFSKKNKPNLFVSSGLKLAKFGKSFQSGSKHYSEPVSTYLYLGNDELVVPTISKLKDKETQAITLKELSKLNLKHSQIVFDAESFSYKDIIANLQKFSGNANSFRIKPRNCDFILGSDASDSKGEVFLLVSSD